MSSYDQLDRVKEQNLTFIIIDICEVGGLH